MSPQPLGQHFLGDAAWRERIAQAVLSSGAPNAGVWIEIGAGHGEMTQVLARSAERVVAIELDAKLLQKLRADTAPLSNVSIVSGDVLALDLPELAGAGLFSVYGNLPYYITSPIVHRLLEHANRLQVAFLVMQMEVAERLVAPPGGRDRGYLSVFTQFYSQPEILLRIPPGAFRPPPKVNSALVRLRMPGEQARLTVADEAGFLAFLKACFAQKRKTLRNNLRALLSESAVVLAFEQAAVPTNARAEQLTLSQLAATFAAIGETSQPGGSKATSRSG